MGRRRPIRREPDWVSKTNIIDYHRCPYAFWLIDTGQASAEEAQPELLNLGEEFEAHVLSEMIPTPRISLKSLPAGDHWLYGLPLLKDPKRRICGKPDGVRTAHGVLEPVEIKAHSKVKLTDRLELAFYWLLLAQFRKRRPKSPRGYVRLRDNAPLPRPVSLHSEHFARVKELIDSVRRARREGVRPLPCDCPICLERSEVRALRNSHNDLVHLYGIGQTRAAALCRLGVSTSQGLLDADSADIVRRLREKRVFVSSAIVDGWKAQASAWKLRRPVWFGDEGFNHRRFILLDLEYDCWHGDCGRIWLTGIHIQNGSQKTIQIWSDTEPERRAAMGCLRDVLLKFPELPVLTWSGKSAELPQLKALVGRLSIKGVLDIVSKRHIDAFQFATENIRLPLFSYGLKEVAEFFRFSASSEIADGMEAIMKYHELCKTFNSARRRNIRKQLEVYNRDDLMRLKLVVERFCQLAT